MATPYSDVYDSFMLVIKDYKLTDLFEASEPEFETYLLGFLINSIVEFHNCAQDLTDRSDVTFTFNITLTDTEIFILAQFMVKHWLTKEVNDVLEFKNLLNDRDFKHHSEAQNLKQKQNYLSIVRETTDHYSNTYSYINNFDWESWADGDFGYGG